MTLEEMQAEKAAIDRRQRIAEMLMQQGQEPIDTNQQAGGYVVPVSPLTAISKIAQQLSGAYIGNKADKEKDAIQARRLKQLSEIDFSSPTASNDLAKAGMIEEAIKMRMSNAQDGPVYDYLDTTKGVLRVNKRGTDIEELPYSMSRSSPELQANITAGREGQKGVELTDAKGHPYRSTQYSANPRDFKNLIGSLINVESGGNPNAVSPKGATGLTQIMPETAKNPGYGVQPMQGNTPDEQIRFGSDYLRAMIKQNGGDVKKGLAAYNAGLGNVDSQAGNEYAEKVLGPVMGQSPAEAAEAKARAELPIKIEEKQAVSDIENQQKIEQERNKRTEGAKITGQTLNQMYRYLYPSDESGNPVINRDETGRLVPPDEKMITGASPADRLRMLYHEYSNTEDPLTANTTQVKKLGAQLVLAATGGSLGAQISNADRSYLERAQGILESSQNITDVYNAISDIEAKIKEITGAKEQEDIGLTPEEQQELEQLRLRFKK